MRNKVQIENELLKLINRQITLVTRSNRLALAPSPLLAASFCRLTNSLRLCSKASMIVRGTGATTTE